MKVRSIALATGLLLAATLLSVPVAGGAAVADDKGGRPGATELESGPSDAAKGTGLRGGSGGGWKPQDKKVVLNNPFGGVDQRYAIQQYLVKAIRNTPKTGTIRISVYSFDRGEVADALIAAHRRGVRVQILMNDHQVTRAQRRLFNAIGRSPARQSFAYECKASCRGGRNNLHSKFFLFSRTGGVDNVVMAGSVNFTLNAVKWQWNDLLSLTNEAQLFKNYVTVFDDMRKDYSKNRPFRTFCGKPGRETCSPTGNFKFLRVFPRASSPRNDAVLKMMDPIRCTYRSGGQLRRTQVRLSMHTMRGARGDYLATRVRRLWANGCDVKVIYGLMGFHTKSKLGATTARGRVPLRSAGFDYDGDGDVNRYTHQKNLTINGMYGGKNTKISFTGSSNWSVGGTSGDEIIFSIRNAKVWGQYDRHFKFMFGSNRFTRNAYTTTSSSYRTTAFRMDPATGRPVLTPITVERTVEQNLPDRIEGDGPTWEDD